MKEVKNIKELFRKEIIGEVSDGEKIFKYKLVKPNIMVYKKINTMLDNKVKEEIEIFKQDILNPVKELFELNKKEMSKDKFKKFIWDTVKEEVKNVYIENTLNLLRIRYTKENDETQEDYEERLKNEAEARWGLEEQNILNLSNEEIIKLYENAVITMYSNIIRNRYIVKALLIECLFDMDNNKVFNSFEDFEELYDDNEYILNEISNKLLDLMPIHTTEAIKKVAQDETFRPNS